MKFIIIWVCLMIVVGLPAFACCHAAGEADRQADEHFEKMVKERRTEDKL